MQLIDEGFVGWYKKYSVLALLFITAFSSAWVASPDLQKVLGPDILAVGNTVVAVLGFIGRFIKQTDGVIAAGLDD